MANKIKISKNDLKILEALKSNGRASLREIAKITKSSPAAIHKKIKRWMTVGFIERFTVDINWELLGRNYMAYISIQTDFKSEKQTPKDYDILITKILKMPQSKSVHLVTGRTDIIAKAWAKTSKELFEYICKLRHIEGIGRTETYISIFNTTTGEQNSSKKINHDKTHLEVLKSLQENCRQSLREIANRINISHTKVQQCLKELIDSNIIKRFTLKLNHKVIGNTVEAIIFVSLDYGILSEKNIDQSHIIKEITAKRDVEYGSAVAGRIDLILFAACKTIEHLDNLMIEIRSIKGVSRTESMVAARSVRKDIDNMDVIFDLT